MLKEWLQPVNKNNVRFCSCFLTGCDYHTGMQSVVGTDCTDAGRISFEQWCSGVDIDMDGNVTQADVDLVNYAFGTSNCSLENNWCAGTDVNLDGVVSSADRAIVGQRIGYVDCGTLG